MLLNPNWRIDWSIFDLINPNFKLEFDFGYWGLAAMMLPFFYLIYLPFLAPEVSILLLILLILDSLDKTLVPVELGVFLKTVFYFIRYDLTLAAITDHKIVVVHES